MDEILARKNQTIVYIVLAAVVVSLLAISSYLYLNLQRERREVIACQAKVQEAQEETRGLETDLKEEINARTSLEALLELAKEKAAELETKIEESTKELAGYKEKLEALEKDNLQLQQKLEALAKEKDDLSRIAKEKEFSSKELEDRIRLLENEKANLAKRLSQIKSITLNKIEVRKDAEPQPYQTESGKVLAINERFGFVIFSLGKDKGVDAGLPFLVYRGSELIARLKVEKVYERMSAGKILTEGALGKIRINDQVEYGE